MADERLERAIGLIQARNMNAAREVLELILKEDRNNIQAWHWYVQTWPKAREKVRVWEACLRFNPTDQLAIEAIKDLNFDPQKQSKPTTVIPKRRAGPSPWLWGLISLLVAVATFVWALVDTFVPKNPEPYKHVEPVEYYLYVPKAYSPEKEWPLFVGIHGAGGNGLECWYLWQRYAEKEGFILLCPSIPGFADGYYQDVGETTVWTAVTEVKKDYRIQKRMFLSGFSAGGVFIQGFASHYPGYVRGLSILSSGLYVEPDAFPELIPMLVVMGGSDDPFAVKTSLVFVAGLQGYGFDVNYVLLPGIGHAITPDGIKLTIDLFRKTTGK